MAEIILHHFDSSPFAEKVRLALGLKGLDWRSVEIPMVMPKPLLTALTGGYRKTPVMQIGADIYCDTQCIAVELERRFPRPTLFPHHSEALAIALSQWSDNAFFQPGAGLSMGTNAALPEDILRDRREFFNFLDFATLERQLPHLYSQFRAHLQLVESMVSDGRQFVLGDVPGWLDILAYFPIWMCRGNIAKADDLLRGLSLLQAWEQRVKGIGHGRFRVLAAEEALAVARDTQPVAVAEICEDSWPDLSENARVVVSPQDYGAVPVEGSLLRLTHSDIAIRRESALTGEVVVHFPRLGYRVETA
ncbi:MAG: glutathione S-transferase [Gammaproteobacteria bacterium]|nr:glutathione S-transferase [Gammaproteobacteria bacterium]